MTGPPRPPLPWRRPGRRDAGSAVVEFCYLSLLLLIPLAYLLLTVFRLQAAGYAAAGATREAARSFVLAGDPSQAADAALAAARLAAGDHGLELEPDALDVSCSPGPGCGLEPGQRVQVTVRLEVPLPLVPRVLAGRAPASIAVSASSTDTVDRFRGSRPDARR